MKFIADNLLLILLHYFSKVVAALWPRMAAVAEFCSAAELRNILNSYALSKNVRIATYKAFHLEEKANSLCSPVSKMIE